MSVTEISKDDSLNHAEYADAVKAATGAGNDGTGQARNRRGKPKSVNEEGVKLLTGEAFQLWENPENWSTNNTTTLKLDRSTCRWPLGDILAEKTIFCGDPTCGDGSTYCERHQAIAYPTKGKSGKAGKSSKVKAIAAS